MSEFQEYPMWMTHPNFKPSKMVKLDPDKPDNKSEWMGTAPVCPPVSAIDQANEEYYAAQGYVRAGKMDPSAWVQAQTDGPGVDYEPAQYPKWVNGTLVGSAEEEAALEEQIPEAPVADTPPPDVQALLARIAELEAGRDTQDTPNHIETHSERMKRIWAERKANQARADA